MADVAVRPDLAGLLGQVKMGMPARDYQRQHRKVQLTVALLTLLQQHGVDMAFQMIHRDQRFVEGKSQCFGVADSHQKCAGQARSLRDR